MAVTVNMPQLGETVTEGTILSWAKEPGDSIAEDEVLLEISTDKVDTEIPSPAAGVVQEILVAEGETVSVGTPLVVIAADGEEMPAPAEPALATPDPAPTAPEPAREAAPARPARPAPAPEDDARRRGILSPVVRRLAAEHGIDLDLIAGSGTGGRITRKDVMSFIESGAGAGPDSKVTLEPAPTEAAPAPPRPAEQVEEQAAASGDDVAQLSRLRRRIAENMLSSRRTAAHVWTSVEVDYESVERVRGRHRAEFKEQEGFSLTYLPFISRATIDALFAYPVVNSSLSLEEGTVTRHGSVQLGVAVDLNEDGLLVATVRDADQLRMVAIAREVRRLATTAKAGKIALGDLGGSTFTITNPGPFGSYMSAPIINVPNVGILSTETVVKRPTVVTLPDGSDAVAIRHIGYLGLSWDHRAFDGSTALLFLNRVKENLETWDWEQELS